MCEAGGGAGVLGFDALAKMHYLGEDTVPPNKLPMIRCYHVFIEKPGTDWIT